MGRTNSFASVVRMAQPSVRAWWKATYMVIEDLPVPLGLTAAGELAEPVEARRVQKFGVTARQVMLDLVDARPDSAQAFAYMLGPKYPIKAKATAAVVHECCTPAGRAAPWPVQRVVEDRKLQRGDGGGTLHGRLSSARLSRHDLKRLSQRVKVRRTPLRPAPTSGGPGE
jgi:hypothetical protein